MKNTSVPRRRVALVIWCGLLCAIIIPIAIAATSPFLASRDLPYLIGGFAGIVCLALLLIQPLLAVGILPILRKLHQRKWHRWIGSMIIITVFLHIGGLYVTSPPDTLDALLLVSPTPFSVYGVVATVGVILTAVLVALRKRLPLGYTSWRVIHNLLAFIIVVATLVHALQIEGAMGPVSKWALCISVFVVMGAVLLDLWVFKPLHRKRTRTETAEQIDWR